MSRLAEFRHLEQELARQMAELENMKNDEGLKREVEFETKLRDLLAEYNFSLKNIIAAIDPQSLNRGAPQAQPKRTRRPRQVKVYKNPHSGETVETKGGNHSILKQWKAEHGHDEVETWLQ